MSTLYLDCTYGSLKDSFAKAIVGLLPETGRHAEINSLLAEARGREESEKGKHHHHHSMQEVQALISGLGLSRTAENYALGTYGIIAEAEARAHNVDVGEVHFHEVGAPDAVMFICAACEAMALLAPDRIVASPVCTGFGYIDCAHGRLSIPAPATANILDGIPHYSGDREGELTTPTGAALVRFFADEYSDKPLQDAQWTAKVGA